MIAMNWKIIAQATLYDNVINVFVNWPHVWVIASLENENEVDWKYYYALFFTKTKLPSFQRKA